MKVTIGHSSDIDLHRAVDEVLSQANAQLDGASATAGILFVANSLDHTMVVGRIRQAFPDTLLVGCTTAGEASSVLGFQDDSVLLVLFTSPDVLFATAIGRNPSKDADHAAVEAFSQIQDQLGDETPRLCVMLSDAVHGDPDKAMQAFAGLYGDTVPIIGGAAGSYPPGDTTHLFHNDEILMDAMVMLVFAGPLDVATASETSWRPIGKTGQITNARGKTIYRINDAPALDFYREMLGVDASVFLGAPLAILEPDGSVRVRSPVSFDADNHSIDVIGGVTEGDTIQLAFATVDDVRHGADKVIAKTLDGFPENRSPAFVFFCSCLVRKMFLALDVDQEFEQLQNRVGASVPIFGFYAYGEIGSATTGASAQFHNQAIVSVAVG